MIYQRLLGEVDVACRGLKLIPDSFWKRHDQIPSPNQNFVDWLETNKCPTLQFESRCYYFDSRLKVPDSRLSFLRCVDSTRTKPTIRYHPQQTCFYVLRYGVRFLSSSASLLTAMPWLQYLSYLRWGRLLSSYISWSIWMFNSNFWCMMYESFTYINLRVERKVTVNVCFQRGNVDSK